ncbi:hypothetical protein VE04_09216 [Pseudogymnoascus sp. 24MN13]|nr:hypothetical protein VE04_09216 [Pseudogymnoascus sp. 24MN13]
MTELMRRLILPREVRQDKERFQDRLPKARNRPTFPGLADDAICGLHAIHQLGVLQGDPVARNILVHPDRLGITWIDFERAEFVRPRAVLGILSPNRKRELGRSHEEGKCQNGKSSKKTPASEIGQAKTELARLVVKQGEPKKSDSRMNSLRKLPLMSLVTDISVRDSPNSAHEFNRHKSRVTQEATSHSTISTSISDVNNAARYGWTTVWSSNMCFASMVVRGQSRVTGLRVDALGEREQLIHCLIRYARAKE